MAGLAETLFWQQFGGSAYGVIDDLCLWSLQNIVMELAIRAGMDPTMIDASELQSIKVRGFTVINQYPATNAIRALSDVFMFDPSNYDGVVHFTLRGKDTVATITTDDFVLDDPNSGFDNPVQNKGTRADSIQIPRQLNLNYFDVSGGLATSLQSSTRSSDPRATGSQDLQSPVIMNADEAKRVVTINHKVMIEDNKNQFNFKLSDKFLGLVPANNIFIPVGSKYVRARITQIEINDGHQSYQLLQDRQSAYNSASQLEGYPAYTPTEPPSAIVGPTIIQPIDSRIISDSDDSLGCYIALGISTQTWQGAIVELSVDGGANYIDNFTGYVAAVMGTIRDSFEAHPVDYPDQANAFSVELYNVDDELYSANQEQLQNRTNLCIVGDEIMQFGDAVQTTSGSVWDISYLLRGRKGTDAVAHAAGERFVMMDRSGLYFLPAELAYLGKTLTLRATSLNGTDTDITTTTFVYNGNSQVEYPVAYLSASRDGAGSGTISWQGVGKLGSGASVAMGIYFKEYLVTLTDGVTTQTYHTTDQSLTSDLSAFSGDVTATVSAVNTLTGEGPGVAVIF